MSCWVLRGKPSSYRARSVHKGSEKMQILVFHEQRYGELCKWNKKGEVSQDTANIWVVGRGDNSSRYRAPIIVCLCLRNYSKFNFTFTGQRSNWHCKMIILLVCKVQETAICLEKLLLYCMEVCGYQLQILCHLPQLLPKLGRRYCKNVICFDKISAKIFFFNLL